MNDPIVSVIIPAYNSEKFIGETLYSVVRQSFQAMEIIVVDDGSTDGQNEIIKTIMKEDARIKLIQQANRGVSAARNLGIEHAKGQYLAFLDADDVWLPHNIKVKVEFLQG